MKVSELEGAELDYWVAKAQGYAAIISGEFPTCKSDMGRGLEAIVVYRPSDSWDICGPLIEKYGISLDMRPSGKWDGIASKSDTGVKWINYCNTPQQAICRAVVASVYGEEVGERE